ncbi:hypothetical protein FEM08_30050 [Flavobacterium gilvum]|nr:hypothetical protein FEM08_30050 [Flavobacterium gilvum]
MEADLISIAHRILQLKNKSDINQLFLETQKLYEKLAILRFVEEHFSDAKPTIGQAEVVEKMKAFFETISVPEFQKPPTIAPPAEEEPVAEIIEDAAITSVTVEEIKEEENTIEQEEITAAIEELPTSDTVETVEEIKEETVVEKPLFTLDKIETEPVETPKPETPKKKEAVQISFDDLLSGHYTAPDFVKVSSSDKKTETNTNKSTSSFDIPKESVANTAQEALEKAEPKTVTLNDKLAKEINIGLNDRIAFVKHLFAGDNEDYNRVVSQLITFDNYPETKAFIDEMVKPDYNNWEGKEDYEHRFMEIIEKKFLSF